VRTDEQLFEQHRTHLLGVGYRITGSLADAEDAVQEAWLRLASLDDTARAELRDDRAWLTTVVGRLCLDRLRSAVAFVLHEALALPFTDIADVLGCPEATARQHAARARRIVADADPPPRARTPQQRAVLAAFSDAVARADGAALVELLAPDAVWVADSDGRTRAARRPVVGAEKITRLVLGLLGRYGPEIGASWDLVEVNGDLGFAIPPTPMTPAAVTAFAVDGGRITAVYQMLNPEKLAPGRLRRSPDP